MHLTYRDKMNNAVVLYDFYKKLQRIISKPRKIEAFWPSEASADYYERETETIRTIGKCQRAIFYSQHNVIPTTANGYLSIKRMKLGDLVEANEIHYGHLMSTKILSQIPLQIKYDNIVINGKIDEIVFDNLRSLYDLIEHKSGYGWNFEKDIIAGGTYKPEHAMQIGLYIYGGKFQNLLAPFGIEANQIGTSVILYTSRGNCENADDVIVDVEQVGITHQIKVYARRKIKKGKDNPIEIKDTVDHLINIENIFTKCKHIYDCSVKGVLPENDFAAEWNKTYLNSMLKRKKISDADKLNISSEKKIPWQCSYCQYHEMCIKNEYPKTLEEYQKEATVRMEDIKISYKDQYGIDLQDIDNVLPESKDAVSTTE